MSAGVGRGAGDAVLSPLTEGARGVAATPAGGATRVGQQQQQQQQWAARTSRTRCLLVASNFPPVRGGSAVAYGNLCRFAGRAVTVLAPTISYQSGRPLEGWREVDREARFRVHRLPLLRPLSVRPRSRPHGLWLFVRRDLPLMARLLWTIRRIVRREQVGVVCIGELVYGGWLVAPCRHLLGCKVILYVHGEELTMDAGGRGLAQRLKGAHLRLADAVAVVSTFTRDAVIALAGVDPNRIEVIFNGVDTTRFHPRPKDPALLRRYGLEGRRVLLTVGRLVERKGIDRTLQALPLVRARHPDVRYLIVGDGPYRAELARIAAEAGVSDHVIFAGSVSDAVLPDHYAAADVFVMPNRALPDGDTEGFGLVFLEANACGVPVVAGLAGGAADAVRDGENGLTVDGDDPAAIAAAVLRLLDDSELSARLRAGGLARAGQSDWRGRARQLTALCRRLVGAPPPPEAPPPGT